MITGRNDYPILGAAELHAAHERLYMYRDGRIPTRRARKSKKGIEERIFRGALAAAKRPHVTESFTAALGEYPNSCLAGPRWADEEAAMAARTVMVSPNSTRRLLD